MTAGHCVDASASSMSVVAGMHDMRQRYGTPVRYQIERVYRHESYGRGSGGTPNDIAMLKLKSPISFNSHTKAIAIDKTGRVTELLFFMILYKYKYLNNSYRLYVMKTPRPSP